MNDLLPFKHGEEGTHAVCNKHNIGGASVCCECTRKTDCSDTPNNKCCPLCRGICIGRCVCHTPEGQALQENLRLMNNGIVHTPNKDPMVERYVEEYLNAVATASAAPDGHYMRDTLLRFKEEVEGEMVKTFTEMVDSLESVEGSALSGSKEVLKYQLRTLSK